MLMRGRQLGVDGKCLLPDDVLPRLATMFSGKKMIFSCFFTVSLKKTCLSALNVDILSIGASIRLISSSPLRLTQVRGSTISSFLTYRSNSFQEVKGIYMECQPVFFWIFLDVRSWKPAVLVRYLIWRNSPTAIIGGVFFARNISPVISVFGF